MAGLTPRIALTSGEPAGIGPDLCLQIASRPLGCELVCLADQGLLAERSRLLGLEVRLVPYDPAGPCVHEPGTLRVLHTPLGGPCRAGHAEAHNARYVLSLLDRAIDGATAGEFAGLVTAPVHKGITNTAGIPFSGHTEYLALRTGAARPVMMLAVDALRVALATTHLPLRQVSDAISTDSLCEIIGIIA